MSVVFFCPVVARGSEFKTQKANNHRMLESKAESGPLPLNFQQAANALISLIGVAHVQPVCRLLPPFAASSSYCTSISMSSEEMPRLGL